MKAIKLPVKPLNRKQLVEITGGSVIIRSCSPGCCPTDGRPRCPKLICPDVVCPQYM